MQFFNNYFQPPVKKIKKLDTPLYIICIYYNIRFRFLNFDTLNNDGIN